MDIGIYIQRNDFFSILKLRTSMLVPFLIILLAKDTLAHSPLRRVDLQVKEVTIPEGLDLLGAKSGLDINYNDQLFKSSSKVSLDAKNMQAIEVLKRLLNGTRISYRVVGDKTVLLYRAQEPGRISGRVTDERGEPLPGASLKVIETGLTVQSSVDGSYNFSLPPGTYTIEVRFVGYQTRRITGVKVAEGGQTPLPLAMKPATRELEAVTVTGSYQRATIEGLYVRQKNAASVTDGISAEQISRTPDNNMGQVLRRVSGVTTVDNKYVVVRGLTERYNQAMIDGVVLPSTDMNRRNFSFDVLPQELVSNVVVNKTATPDISAEFSGGQVSVNTLDIPEENFTSFTIGSGYNSQSTGKDFLMLGQRGDWDYLGYDDGRRKEPQGIVSWQFPSGVGTPPPGPPGNDYPLIPGQEGAYSSLDALAQSKKLSSEGLAISRYTAFPYQNARFALGRVYDLKKGLRFGFTGGATYRNQQNIVDFNNVRGAEGRNYMDSTENGAGRSYRFSSTTGAVLNLGLQGPAFKLAFKNMYSHIYDNNFYESYHLDYGGDNESRKFRDQFQDPQATGVWQHKLEGENLLGNTGLRLAYTGGITSIGQKVQDRRRLRYQRSDIVGGVEYYREPNIFFQSINSDDNDYRMWTDIDETDYNWGVSLDRSFDLGSKVRNTAKIGYSGWSKHRTLGVTKMVPYTISNYNFRGPYFELLDPANMGTGLGQAYYWAEDLNGPTFDGKMKTQAVYAMLDQRFFQKLRLVYGLRAEHYNLANRQEDYIIRRFGEIDNNWELFSTTGEKNWRMLPSANLTYSLTSSMNVRAAYGKTAIRPDFRETAYFGFDDIELQANISGRQLTSTIVDNFDLRYEWYPSAGEIISISGFYKKLKDPIELVYAQRGFYRFQNQHGAKNYGLEMEIRKSLGFIAGKAWLRNLTIFGNGTILKSKVEIQTIPMPGEENTVKAERLPAQDRPLYGQAPWIVNAGLAYQDRIVGFTASYNLTGHRSNTINFNPGVVEYEKGRNLLDVQVSGKVLRQRGQLKLNLSNLLDEYSLFYVNVTAYETGKDADGNTNHSYKLVNGTTAYEKDKGDEVTYRTKTGRTATLSFTYNF